MAHSFLEKWVENFSWFRIRAELRNAPPARDKANGLIMALNAVCKSVTGMVGAQKGEAVFFHILSVAQNVKAEIIFCGFTPERAELWRQAFETYIGDPVIESNFSIVSLGDVEARNYQILDAEIKAVPERGPLCLEFATPVMFAPIAGHNNTYLDRDGFAALFVRRFERLFGQAAPQMPPGDFFVLPYYWNYIAVPHASRSQTGQTQYIKGCAGKLYVKGDLREIMPLIKLGLELHAGTKLANAQGYCKIAKDSGFFEPRFPQKELLAAATRDTLDAYDEAGSDAAASGLLSDESDFVESVARALAAGNYRPAPNTAFSVPKTGGGARVLEKLNFKDLAVSRFTAKLLEPYFDRMFEECSIGFRRGVSREKAVQMVAAAAREGYGYAAESDIENFFSCVDHAILERALDRVLPDGDIRVRQLIGRIIRAGYLDGGVEYPRERGLAQGNPLSPLLANLYLDAFDEAARTWGVRLIRYADDILMLARDKDQAARALAAARETLAALSLKLSGGKTAIRPISEGFDFLGIEFENGAAKIDDEKIFKAFKKPLYITEPYLYLSASGDFIEIRNQGIVRETLPLRRVSEIMVMAYGSFSTSLVRQCVLRGIPLTIVLESGYYITTIKPDSRQYHDTVFRHGQAYARLSESERLAIAKAFAAGKLKNFKMLVHPRYQKGDNRINEEIDRAAAEIFAAADVFQVRGLEGGLTKKMYRLMSRYLNGDFFRFKKREKFRPDPINSILNFCYYLLFSYISAMVRAAGLNPYLGFLHSPADNYESLVCDIQELFRPRIIRFAVRCANLKIVGENDFIKTEKGWYLKRAAARKIMAAFEIEMNQKKSGEILNLKENIYAQVQTIKKWALENGSLSFYHWNQ